MNFGLHTNVTLFSPYSRGWSHQAGSPAVLFPILPVFAGMVLTTEYINYKRINSPRIRGDGPPLAPRGTSASRFSPYSRGWSLRRNTSITNGSILPVFAGMVPLWPRAAPPQADSPRIRGDGPRKTRRTLTQQGFSPYSRGWSRTNRRHRKQTSILPVFAGMVRAFIPWPRSWAYSPRIRGDGPCHSDSSRSYRRFSPYSRGWSRSGYPVSNLFPILPVFAGMVPALS